MAYPLRRTLRLEAPGSWQMLNLAELWAYRELLFFFVWRDVKVRYKQTVLGAAWAVIQPLTTTFAFTILFGRFGGMSKQVEGPYALHVFVGHAAVDVLRERGGGRREQPDRQQSPHQQGLFSAHPDPDRRHRGEGSSISRSRSSCCS